MNRFLTKGTWEFESSSKIDVLQEPPHTHLIIKLLNDRDTGIESNPDDSFVLYGPEEAVLVIPSRVTTRLLLLWSFVVKRLAN